MNADQEIFYEACLALEIGKMPVSHPMYPFSVHRYDDCWWVMPHQPTKENLGQELPDTEQLQRLIEGKPFRAKAITKPEI